jgi:chaperonin GroES
MTFKHVGNAPGQIPPTRLENETSVDELIQEAISTQPQDLRGRIPAALDRAAPEPKPKVKRILHPWVDRILVKPNPVEEFFSEEANLVKPDTSQEKPVEGVVVEVGMRFRDAEEIGAGSLSPGDTVLYSRFTGAEVTFDGEEFILLRQDEIVGYIVTPV